MMNKCRGKIVQGDYIMGNIFHRKGGEKNLEKRTGTINLALRSEEHTLNSSHDELSRMPSSA